MSTESSIENEIQPAKQSQGRNTGRLFSQSSAKPEWTRANAKSLQFKSCANLKTPSTKSGYYEKVLIKEALYTLLFFTLFT